MTNNQLLTRAECNALRGLAILGIVLHNFCHWLGPVVKENEYQYFQHNVDWFLQVVAHTDQLLPAHVLSFFGHYGVPIFLFLSAYGLEMKYGRAEEKVRTVPFVRYHFLKLFKMMFVGFIIFLTVDAITPGAFHYTVIRVIGQLGMFNNLFADPDHNIWPGPYWYFGLTLQLYVVYRLFIYKRSTTWTAVLMAICVTIQLGMAPESSELNWYRYNFMGGMLPFGFGILFARYRLTSYEKMLAGSPRSAAAALFTTFLFASFIIVGGSMNFVMWAFVPMFVCVAAIALVQLLGRLPLWGVGTWLFRTLTWFGSISAALFVIHPTVRKVFIPIARHGDVYTGLLIYVIVSIGAAWAISKLMKHIPSPHLESSKFKVQSSK